MAIDISLGISSVGHATGLPMASESGQVATTELAPVSVTAPSSDPALSRSMHSVTVLDREDIRKSSAENLDEALALVNGVTIRRRGAPGVQSDIGIRGSSFKQTQILIDGVPIQSPQSSHLNSNLPIPLSSIDRIEVIKGPGAIEYGGSGTGGIINIITRRADHRQDAVEMVGGSHASRQVNADIGTGSRDFSSLLSASASYTDSEKSGHPSDADIRQALYTGDATIDALHLKWGLGASRKKYGAWGFYSDVLPDAREQTRSRMGWLDASLPLGKWTLHGRTYRIGQKDRFLTLANNNTFLNRHKTDVGGLDADVKRWDRWGTTIVGGKFRHEQIHSNSLGGHHRNETAVWLFRHQRITDELSSEVGVNRVDYQNDKAYWLPSVSLAWQFNDRWRTYASWARSARAPTYTELYSDTPANQGNPHLGTEKSEYYELGLNGYFHQQQLEISVYRRHTSGFIDFARQSGQTSFQAANLHGFRTTGAEIDWHWHPGWRWLDKMGLGYSRMHNHLGTKAAKNTTHIPRQTIRANLRMPLKYHLHLAVDVRRPTYKGQPDATLVAARWQWRHKKTHVYLGLQNLLNRRIIEAGFAPIAGRWINLGMGIRF